LQRRLEDHEANPNDVVPWEQIKAEALARFSPMTLPIIFRGAARVEFDDAADWYEQRQTGLGTAYTAAVQQVLDQITAQPALYPQVYGDVREALVSGFPFCVYYREEPGQIVVLSVFHTSRNPAIWQRRA